MLPFCMKLSPDVTEPVSRDPKGLGGPGTKGTKENEALTGLALVHAKAPETQTFIKRLAGSTYFD